MKKSAMAYLANLLAVWAIAAYLWHELRTARDQIAALQSRVNELQTQMPTRAMSVPASTVSGAGAATNSGAARSTDAAAAAMSGTRPSDRARSMAEGFRQMLDSPQGRDMARSTVLVMLRQRLPDLAKELNLPPAAEEKLLDLISRQQADLAVDSIGMLGQAQDAAGRQQIQRKLQERQKANEAEIAKMLGSKYPQFQQYQQSLPTRQGAWRQGATEASAAP